MPRINVTAPFKVKFPGEKKHRVFEPGEHELTEKELQDWFIQGCIAAGRAEILPVAQTVELVPPGMQANHDEFAAAMLGEHALSIPAELVPTTETNIITPEVKTMKVEAKPVAMRAATKKAGK